MTIHWEQVEPDGRTAKERMQDCIFEVWGVLSAACELCGDPERAVGWFKGHEIADFGGKTPMQLCQEGKAQTVRDYIESLSAGASG